MPDALPSQDPATVNEMVTSVLTASRVLVAISARSLAAVEDTLTVPQFRMLVVLDTNGATSLSRLAEQLAVNPSTAMRMVDRLSAAGMVERTPDPEDRRVVRLVATEPGRRVVHAVTERRQAEITRIVATMPHEHRSAMVRALQAFADAAGEAQVDPTAYGSTGLPGWT
ncbi:MarR family transcriptional regulator [Streptacidiphilus sp. PB12-B1b]|uniref:MarR family winged helix-turn-helix transcriptional regulator n=1 Tax=Streptacidiphilus sp. PB12-B1b TaxID=2705012 RepID=UPI0015F8A311|nr:MarR family transcriptional regulator [Streptacidiphilus sp. PB12-B1b]QMU74788.1 MarR family transcriptional regulator [Streptacidiphilus sp. PB12-B1b]